MFIETFLLFSAGVLLQILFLPWFHVQLFFPLLAMAALQHSRVKALWIAAIAGSFIDLLGSSANMGLHATIFSLVMMILYSHRRFFEKEKWLSFAIYASAFGSLASFFLAIAIHFQRGSFSWSLEFIAIDLLLLPLCDACIGWLLFIAPKTVYRLVRRLLMQWRWRTF
jgi:rod shape-determining protein MreD